MLELLFRFIARTFAIPVLQVLRRPAIGKCIRAIGRTLGLTPTPPQGIVTTTREWARVNSDDGRKLQQIFPVDVIRRRLPRTIEAKTHWHFQKNSEKQTPEVFLATIPNGKVLGAYGSVISGDNIVLGDLAYEWFFGSHQHSSLFKFKLPPVQKLNGSAANLATTSGWNYYHWLLDLLPRFDILQRGGVDLGSVDSFIVNAGSAPYQTDTLDLLGIPKSKRVVTQRRAHFQADTLYAPSLPGLHSHTPKWAVDFLRKSFLRELSGTRRKIYVSRSRSKYRKFTNEPEVKALLEKHGFEEVFSEELSFRQQVDLFASAEAIVAPHGAGLANILFCQPKTFVLEIFSPDYVNGCFWALAEQAELDYWYLLGKGARPAEFADPHKVEKNIEADVMQVEKTLRAVGLT